jgi:hypothetical protein
MSATITATLPSRWDDERGIWVGPEKVSAKTSAAQRIVAHPDGSGFALLDTFGDYLRSHHGFVMQFTKAKAAALLGVDLSKETTA